MSFKTKEAARLEALKSYHILDTPEEEEYNALARLASQICGTLTSQINLIDAHRQWTKSSMPEAYKEMPREGIFCNYTIQQDEWMMVSDTAQDDRFNEQPYVKNEPGIRFYAGVNLKSDDGFNIGTICVLDTQPKELTEDQLNSLKILAHEVEARLELRKQQYSLEEKNKKLVQLNTFLKNSTDLVFKIDPAAHIITEMNPQVEKFLEYKHEELVGHPLETIIYDENFKKKLKDWQQQSADEFIEEALFQAKSGQPVWMRIHLAEKEGLWYATARDINQRRLQEKSIQQSLEEKEVLLAEIHHRVKNNLAVISSLLQLESLNTQSKEVQKSLHNSHMRIQSMSIVHELLYQSGDFTNVSFKPFIDNIIRNMDNLYSWKNGKIIIQPKIDEIQLNVNQAIPLALIINELISNAYTHAFIGRCAGTISMQLTQTDGYLDLAVSDDGTGLPANIDVKKHNTTGFTLVTTLSDQLNASLEVDTNDKKGTKFLVHFKKTNDKGSSSSMTVE